ncbi:MAG: alpha/beta hydrolase [Candidatus Gastranaerophilaceae bacterium]
MALFKKLIIFSLAIMTLLSFNVVEAKESKMQIQTIDYASDLRADLFSKTSKKQIPAIILIHGGYWSAGNRKELSDFATKLAGNGYLAMTIDYHLLPKYKQGRQVEDVTEAIWWLRENSKRLGVNSSKIGVVGISSGGYLVAWAATHDKISAKGSHSRPNAAVCLCGPWDLSPAAEKEISPDSIKLIESFCAGEDRKLASPQYAISSSVPPILLIHGDDDKIVPVSQSINAYKQLKSEHCNCKLVIVHKDDHIFPNTPSYFNAMNKSIKFLDKVLK